MGDSLGRLADGRTRTDAHLLSVRRNMAVAANALLSMMQSKGEVSRVHIGGSGSAVARLVFQDTSMQHVLLPCACNKCTAFVTCSEREGNARGGRLTLNRPNPP